MLLVILLIALLTQPAAAASQPTAGPEITPFFSRVADAPAFWVECRNDTGSAVSSGSAMWPLAPGRLRIDGEFFVETGGIIGPGLTVDIEPGGVWRGIIALRQSRDGLSAPVKFGAHVRGGRIIPLSPGRHSIAVKCGESWSAEHVFFWEATP